MTWAAAALAIALAVAPLALAGEGGSEAADFVRLPPPRPGDWRAAFDEPVQTFASYKKTAGRAPGFETRRIRLLPLGEAREGDDELIGPLAEFLGAYFMTRTVIEPRQPMPERVRRRPSRGFGTQYLADDILDAIAPFGLADGTARLAIASEDLYGSSPGGGYLNFVFGMGAAGRRVGLFSAARYGLRYGNEPPGITREKRIFKVAAHELGHVFGLAHCQTYSCGMNGSNSLAESDSRPIHLCPECLEKLEWHLGFDRVLRYRVLAGIYARLGWKDEEAFVARRAEIESSRAAGPARGQER